MPMGLGAKRFKTVAQGRKESLKPNKNYYELRNPDSLD
jgi:hypothetical protein